MCGDIRTLDLCFPSDSSFASRVCNLMVLPFLTAPRASLLIVAEKRLVNLNWFGRDGSIELNFSFSVQKSNRRACPRVNVHPRSAVLLLLEGGGRDSSGLRTNPSPRVPARCQRAFVEIIWFIWRFNQSCISHVLFGMRGSILHVSVLFICTFKWHSGAFLIRGEASRGNGKQITLIPPSLGLNQPKMALCDIFKLQRFSVWNCSVLTKSKITVLFIMQRGRRRRTRKIAVSLVMDESRGRGIHHSSDTVRGI